MIDYNTLGTSEKLSYIKSHQASDDELSLACHDPDWRVREAVAMSKSITQEHIDILKKDTHPYVRASIARNKNTPVKELFKILSSDEHWYVRRGARQHLKKKRLV